MTREEAIKHLNSNEIYTDDWNEAILMAKEALEKQIPKKPVGGVKAAGICPNCGERFLMYQIGMRDFPTPHAFLFDYCLLCGQRIDWS